MYGRTRRVLSRLEPLDLSALMEKLSEILSGDTGAKARILAGLDTLFAYLDESQLFVSKDSLFYRTLSTRADRRGQLAIQRIEGKKKKAQFHSLAKKASRRLAEHVLTSNKARYTGKRAVTHTEKKLSNVSTVSVSYFIDTPGDAYALDKEEFAWLLYYFMVDYPPQRHWTEYPSWLRRNLQRLTDDEDATFAQFPRYWDSNCVPGIEHLLDPILFDALSTEEFRWPDKRQADAWPRNGVKRHCSGTRDQHFVGAAESEDASELDSTVRYAGPTVLGSRITERVKIVSVSPSLLSQWQDSKRRLLIENAFARTSRTQDNPERVQDIGIGRRTTKTDVLSFSAACFTAVFACVMRHKQIDPERRVYLAVRLYHFVRTWMRTWDRSLSLSENVERHGLSEVSQGVGTLLAEIEQLVLSHPRHSTSSEDSEGHVESAVLFFGNMANVAADMQRRQRTCWVRPLSVGNYADFVREFSRQSELRDCVCFYPTEVLSPQHFGEDFTDVTHPCHQMVVVTFASGEASALGLYEGVRRVLENLIRRQMYKPAATGHSTMRDHLEIEKRLDEAFRNKIGIFVSPMHTFLICQPQLYTLLTEVGHVIERKRWKDGLIRAGAVLCRNEFEDSLRATFLLKASLFRTRVVKKRTTMPPNSLSQETKHTYHERTRKRNTSRGLSVHNHNYLFWILIRFRTKRRLYDALRAPVSGGARSFKYSAMNAYTAIAAILKVNEMRYVERSRVEEARHFCEARHQDTIWKKYASFFTVLLSKKKNSYIVIEPSETKRLYSFCAYPLVDDELALRLFCGTTLEPYRMTSKARIGADLPNADLYDESVTLGPADQESSILRTEFQMHLLDTLHEAQFRLPPAHYHGLVASAFEGVCEVLAAFVDEGERTDYAGKFLVVRMSAPPCNMNRIFVECVVMYPVTVFVDNVDHPVASSP